MRLTREFAERFVKYDAGTGWLFRLDSGRRVMAKSGYLYLQIGGKHCVAHRVIWALLYGEEPQEGIMIDHIDGDRQNNKPENLRLATLTQNLWNSSPSRGKASRYKGVAWHQAANKWQAMLTCNGKRIYLGIYVEEKQAALAYDMGARKYFGEFVRVNFNAEGKFVESKAPRAEIDLSLDELLGPAKEPENKAVFTSMEGLETLEIEEKDILLDVLLNPLYTLAH